MDPQPSPDDVRRSRSRVRFNAAMKTMRRAHMYAGLSLAPFVLLYGVTALLFNHPDWFSDRSVRLIYAEDVAGTPLGSFPDARALAARVIDAINRDGSSPVTLSQARPPSYSRDLALTAKTAGSEQIIFVELDGRVGTVRSAPAPKEVSKPAWSNSAMQFNPSPAEEARDAVAMIMTKWGSPPEKVKVRTAPELVFAAESDGGIWRVAYNLQTQALSVRPLESDLSTRRFLTDLHLACRYPTQIGARWFWALIVDAMAVGMVFWGISGLLMWWQMKSLRRFGTFVIVVSLIGSVVVAIGMHDVISR